MQADTQITINSAVYARTESISLKMSKFREIRAIPLPILNDLSKQMDVLRLSNRDRAPGDPTEGMCVLLPPGVGKTTAAKMLAVSAAARAGTTADHGPVFITRVDTEDSISLWNSILRDLGDPYWTVGYPKNLKARAIKLLKKRGVELIIIDEFNHCVDRNQARLLMNTVKELLNAGIAPVVVMGTDDELEQLPRIPAFERRMIAAPTIGPLDWEDPYHKKNFIGFLQGLDVGITSQDILTRSSHLNRTNLAEALCLCCDGVIGYAHWVVRDALATVLRRDGDRIETFDLADAVTRHFGNLRLLGRINHVAVLA